MADDGLTIEGVLQARDTIERRVYRAGTAMIRESTRALEKRIENAIQGAVSGKLWRAIASQVYPKGGIAREPSGSIFVNGGERSRGAIRFFTQPGRIQNDDDFYLAIPLPAAGTRGREGMLTPGEWERRTGVRLRFVFRRGRASLLVADSAVLSAKGIFRRVASIRTKADQRRGFARGATTIPIFVLLPFVPFANSVSLEPLIRQSRDDLVIGWGRAMRAAGEP